jgi:hypothetical protein
MSSFGSEMRKRVAELQKVSETANNEVSVAMQAATMVAVETATQATPPNNAKLAGTNTRTGQLAGHWALDSETTPKRLSDRLQTVLANNMQYASYVDQGHRMDKHYVPGLMKNGSLLEMFPPEFGGIVVGTKTSYVPGIYMTKKAEGKYRTVLRFEIQKRIKEAME